MLCPNCNTKINIPIPINKAGKIGNLVNCSNCYQLFLPTDKSVKRFKTISAIEVTAIIIVYLIIIRSNYIKLLFWDSLSNNLRFFYSIILLFIPIAIIRKFTTTRIIELEPTDIHHPN